MTFKPQILSALFILGTIAVLAILQGHVEIATGSVGGIIALSMKLLERE